MKEYIVQPGDTLYSIARLFEVPTERLLSLNPEITSAESIFVGQRLRIPTGALTRPVIEVNAYIYPVYDPLQWSILFPFLTYLSIFGHEIRTDGTLAVADGAPLTAAAREAGVAPLMVITNAVDGAYSGELAHSVLTNPQAQRVLLGNIAAAAQAAGYYGVNFGFEQLFPEDYAAYADFLRNAVNLLHTLGLISLASIRLVVMLERQAALDDTIRLYSPVIDRFIITPSDLVCTGEFSPIDALQRGLDYIVQYISSPKILLGIPNCCYEWEAPYPPDGAYRVLSLDQADALIRHTQALPETDPATQMTFFRIEPEGETPRVLMCDSAQSLAVMDLVQIYNLGGVSFRTLNLFHLASYQAISVRYDIRKALPDHG